MARKTSLIKNTFIYAIGNLGTKFIGFFMLPFYTAHLSKSEYGYFDLVLVLVSLFVPLISFQIQDGLYRFLIEQKDDKNKGLQIFNSLFAVVLNLVVFNFLSILIISYTNFNIQYQTTIIIFFNLSIIWGQIAQISRGLNKKLVYSLAGLTNAILIALFSLIFISYFHLGVEGILYGYIIAYAFSILYIVFSIKIWRYLKYSKFDFSIWKRTIMYSLPLVPNIVNWWVMNMFDRLFINYYLSIDANGLYAVANKFPSLVLMLNTIFNLAWQDSAIEHYNSVNKNKYYSRTFNKLFVLQLTSVFVLIALTKPMLIILVDEAYFESWKYVPFLYIAMVFSAFSSFYGVGFQASKQTKGAFSSSIIGSVINIALNALLIPVIGLQGAALSTMLAFLMMWIIRIYQTKKYFYISVSKKNILITFISLIFVLILYYLNMVLTDSILILFSLILFIIMNKDFLRSLISRLRKGK